MNFILNSYEIKFIFLKEYVKISFKIILIYRKKKGITYLYIYINLPIVIDKKESYHFQSIFFFLIFFFN